MTDIDEALPLNGFKPGMTSIPVIETLTDEQLAEVNSLIPWNAFVVDRGGRRFGNQASKTKRNKPNLVPDRRISLLNSKFPLDGKSVLEIGCFEGIHTTALSQYGADVWGCDARVVNIVKSAVRCAMFQAPARFFLWDVEQPIPEGQARNWDIAHHVGVFYHLLDPVGHMRRLAPMIGHAMMLDTHVSEPEKATSSETVDGFTYRYMQHAEGGSDCVFAGTFPVARWMHLDDLVRLLQDCGFPRVEQVELRDERSGPRVLLFASRH